MPFTVAASGSAASALAPSVTPSPTTTAETAAGSHGTSEAPAKSAVGPVPSMERTPFVPRTAMTSSPTVQMFPVVARKSHVAGPSASNVITLESNSSPEKSSRTFDTSSGSAIVCVPTVPVWNRKTSPWRRK